LAQKNARCGLPSNEAFRNGRRYPVNPSLDSLIYTIGFFAGAAGDTARAHGFLYSSVVPEMKLSRIIFQVSEKLALNWVLMKWWNQKNC